ncbi:MAG: MBL fold metallo-hydrolase [Lachnospiraceae bacterium]|nr:MBL fold metallo-hydrolase [Lachnospiraceae bacterium]
MRHEPYRARKIFDRTWVIDIGAVCFCYLLEGDEKALVIDTGMNSANLRTYLETITDKPMMAVNTHGHGDHTLCNGYFDEVYMHPEAIIDANYGKNSESQNPREREVPDYSPIPVEEGYIFELGGRRVKVFETPCHSPGDLMFLDLDARLLFTGDNLEVGQVLIFYGNDKVGGTVKRHHEILKKMEAYYDDFDFICPAHNGSPLHKSVLKDFIENDERVLSGIEGTAELPSPSFNIQMFLPNEERRKFIRCSEWKNTWLVYDIRRVFESERLFHVGEGEM